MSCVGVELPPFEGDDSIEYALNPMRGRLMLPVLPSPSVLSPSDETESSWVMDALRRRVGTRDDPLVGERDVGGTDDERAEVEANPSWWG